MTETDKRILEVAHLLQDLCKRLYNENGGRCYECPLKRASSCIANDPADWVLNKEKYIKHRE